MCVQAHVCIHVWAVFVRAYTSMCSCTCVCTFAHVCILSCEFFPLPSCQFSPSVTTIGSSGQDSKGSGYPRRAACLRSLSPLPQRAKSGNRQGGRAKRQEEQGGMFKADLTLKAPGLTSKLQLLKPPAAVAFGTATLPESAGDPWVRRLRDDHAGCQPHALLPSPAQHQPSPLTFLWSLRHSPSHKRGHHEEKQQHRKDERKEDTETQAVIAANDRCCK